MRGLFPFPWSSSRLVVSGRLCYKNQSRDNIIRRLARLRDPLVLSLTGPEHIMDLNYLYHRHQVSLAMSEDAACDCSRIVHRKMADAYASLISAAKLAARESSLA